MVDCTLQWCSRLPLSLTCVHVQPCPLSPHTLVLCYCPMVVSAHSHSHCNSAPIGIVKFILLAPPVFPSLSLCAQLVTQLQCVDCGVVISSLYTPLSACVHDALCTRCTIWYCFSFFPPLHDAPTALLTCALLLVTLCGAVCPG